MEPGKRGQRPRKIAIIGSGKIGVELWKELTEKAAADEIVVHNRSNKWDNQEFRGVMSAVDQANQIRNNYENPTDFSFTTDLGEALRGADIVVVTAGVPRKDGQSRSSLLGQNVDVIRPVAQAAGKFAPGATYIIATNPVDTLTQVFQEESGIDSRRVMGLSGELDRARMVQSINTQMNVAPDGVKNAHVVGQHGGGMVPLLSGVEVEYPGQPRRKLTDLLEGQPEKLKEITTAAVEGGKRLVDKLGTSDHIGPAAALERMVGAVIDTKYRGKKAPVLYASTLNKEAGVYIGQPLEVQSDGSHAVLPLPQLSRNEAEGWKKAVGECKKDLSLVPGRESALSVA